MANNVFANGREIACKAASGKVIAAFPDVCFTPPDKVPPTPPGVPVPYPVTSTASDTDKGTKKVAVSKKEVMRRDASNFKKCIGDNAAQTAKKGIINGKITGKVIFTSWSMNVKIESKNVVRHLDTTTSNHSSPNANEACTWAYFDTGTFDSGNACKDDKKREKEACADKGFTDNNICAAAGLDQKIPNSDAAAAAMGYRSKTDFGEQKKAQTAKKTDAAKCIQAKRCRLVPYKPTKKEPKCCPSQTGDHIIPKSSFFVDKYGGAAMSGWSKYNAAKAPTMCLEGGSCSGTHGMRHSYHKAMSAAANGDSVGFQKEMQFCAESAKHVAPDCDIKCLVSQLTSGHKGMGSQQHKIRHSSTGRNPSPDELKRMRKPGRKPARG